MMHTDREPESDAMTVLHWLLVAAGIASLFATLLGPPTFWIALLSFAVAFVCSRLSTGKKRQYALCFLLGGSLAFMGLFVALMFASNGEGNR